MLWKFSPTIHTMLISSKIFAAFFREKIAYVVWLRDDILKIVNAVSTDLASDVSRTAILGQLIAEDEDNLKEPDEISQYGLRQVRANAKIGLDFAAAMHSFLRADPDIIMIGEIRDRETANISVQASLTGHLVLSTLHTNNAAETVTQLLEMQLDPFNFADALLGLLAQRLARTIRANCREQYHPPKEEYQALAHSYREDAFAQLNISYDNASQPVRGKGCHACRQTGYKGRVGIHELLVATDDIKSLIHARSQGLTTLIQEGTRKCIQG